MGLAHAPYGWRLAPARAPHRPAPGRRRLRDDAGRHAAPDRPRLGRASSATATSCPWRPPTRKPTPQSRCCASSRQQDRPFYLEVGFEEPHRPYDFGGAQPDPRRGVAVPAVSARRPRVARGPRRVPGRDPPDGRAASAPSWRARRRSASPTATCVIFATDHGAAMPRAKCTLYDPGIEMALLWRWPSAGVCGRTRGQRADQQRRRHADAARRARPRRARQPAGPELLAAADGHAVHAARRSVCRKDVSHVLRADARHPHRRATS